MMNSQTPKSKWDMLKLQRLEIDCDIERRARAAQFATYLERLQNSRELFGQATWNAREHRRVAAGLTLAELSALSAEELMAEGIWPELIERAARELVAAKTLYAQWEGARSALNARIQFVERLRRATGEVAL